MPVSYQLLVNALHLPEGTEILNAYVQPAWPGIVHLVVRHADLEDVGEGALLPTVVPQFTVHYRAEVRNRFEFKARN